MEHFLHVIKNMVFYNSFSCVCDRVFSNKNMYCCDPDDKAITVHFVQGQSCIFLVLSIVMALVCHADLIW